MGTQWMSARTCLSLTEWQRNHNFRTASRTPDLLMRLASALLLLLVTQSFTFAADRPLRMPDWLAPFPQARDKAETASASTLGSSYAAPVPAGVVVLHYQGQLR